ncbi:MAG: SGNH/GDSL hydrolase family protein [Bacillota bacterium]|nr:SGNH/GDSL hydrolase family protein [Bacillota bacterium]
MGTDSKKTILCYGDSNTYGYDPATGLRYPEQVRWPGVLRGMLPGHYVIEEGCNGRTASVTPEDEPWKDGRSYLKACLNSHKPIDLIILMLGSNDLKKFFHRTPEEIAAGIREILQTIAEFTQEKQGSKPEVLLVSPPLIGRGIETSAFADSFDADAVGRSEKLAALYEKEAKAFACSGVLKCGFLNAADVIQPSDIDSLHLMPDAHVRLAKAIYEAIDIS